VFPHNGSQLITVGNCIKKKPIKQEDYSFTQPECLNAAEAADTARLCSRETMKPAGIFFRKPRENRSGDLQNSRILELRFFKDWRDLEKSNVPVQRRR
jgi:hypothetical protein